MKKRLRAIIPRLGFAVPLCLMGCASTKPVAKQASEDSKCSIEADAWYALKLQQTCGNTPVAECPEADGLGDEYERRALEACGG